MVKLVDTPDLGSGGAGRGGSSPSRHTMCESGGMVDAVDSKSTAARREGSSPFFRTKKIKKQEARMKIRCCKTATILLAIFTLSKLRMKARERARYERVRAEKIKTFGPQMNEMAKLYRNGEISFSSPDKNFSADTSTFE